MILSVELDVVLQCLIGFENLSRKDYESVQIESDGVDKLLIVLIERCLIDEGATGEG